MDGAIVAGLAVSARYFHLDEGVIPDQDVAPLAAGDHLQRHNQPVRYAASE